MAKRKSRINIYTCRQKIKDLSLTDEQKKPYLDYMIRYTNQIRVQHYCFDIKLDRQIRIDSTGWHIDNRNTMVLTQFPKRVIKETLVKFVKKTENWWEGLPETFKCNRCGFSTTREEIAATYLAHMMKGREE